MFCFCVFVSLVYVKSQSNVIMIIKSDQISACYLYPLRLSLTLRNTVLSVKLFFFSKSGDCFVNDERSLKKTAVRFQLQMSVTSYWIWTADEEDRGAWTAKSHESVCQGDSPSCGSADDENKVPPENCHYLFFVYCFTYKNASHLLIYLFNFCIAVLVKPEKVDNISALRFWLYKR